MPFTNSNIQEGGTDDSDDTLDQQIHLDSLRNGSDIMTVNVADNMEAIVMLPFPTPMGEDITLKLAVDARPGCGGITWASGLVRFTHFSLSLTSSNRSDQLRL